MLNDKNTIVYSYDAHNFNPPAPALVISLSAPVSTSLQSVRSIAILDSGADITVIPEQIVQQLQLKYVDEVFASGFGGKPKKYFVYSVRITIASFGDFVIRTISDFEDHVIVGRDVLNKWLLFLKGPSNIFEISQ